MQAVKKVTVSKGEIAPGTDLPVAPWHLTQWEDSIVAEEPLEVWLKQQTSPSTKPERLMITMRSPGDDINLVTGWLHTSGLISSSSHIQNVVHTGTANIKQGESNQVLVTLMPLVQVNVSQHQRLEYMNSSCGVCGQQSIETLLDKLPKSSNLAKPLLAPRLIFRIASALREKQIVFAQTGGNHGVGLFLVDHLNTSDPQAKLIDVREDVGRHNALDKLIGANLPVLMTAKQDYYGVVLSGRVSFDLVQKAAMSNVSIIIAMGAPSSLAINLAIECDICIVGFVKEHSFNVYSVPEYINTQDCETEKI